MDGVKGLIKEQIGGFAVLSDGKQKKFYERQLEDMKPIEIASVTDVLTKEEIARIKRYVRPKKKECWKNALMTAKILGCEYVEGLVGLSCGLVIDHAFNRIGDKYIDVTFEMALKEDMRVLNDEYVMFITLSYFDAIKAVEENAVWGEIYKRKIYKEIYG